MYAKAKQYAKERKIFSLPELQTDLRISFCMARGAIDEMLEKKQIERIDALRYRYLEKKANKGRASASSDGALDEWAKRRELLERRLGLFDGNASSSDGEDDDE